jgi:hypothetical protein
MGAVLATALAKLVLQFDELTSDSTASNALRAEVCLFLLRARKPGGTDRNVGRDLHHPCRTIQVCHGANR